MAKEQKKEKPTGEKPTGKKSSGKGRWNLYKVDGTKIERLNRFCAKCGDGTFMAKHSSRLTCGKCNYTEFVKKV